MKFSKIFLGEEWDNLKKFNSLKNSEREIVFYAENKASMNHFRTLISELTEVMNHQICYVTSVKDDPILSTNNKNIIPFFIGDKTARTKFFLTLKSKILLMDMPDLETYHIKRSKISPVHYIYIFHSMFSVHSYLRKKALDNFDTIFCVGPHHVKEIRAMEQLYNLKQKKLIEYGFGRLDTLLHEKESFEGTSLNNDKTVLITPSYGKHNILEKCGVQLIDILLKSNYKVFLRPHFRILQESKDLIEIIRKKFNNNPNFTLHDGVIPKEIFHNSSCLISDWSGISMEYAFVFERPVIFIDVPQKKNNPDADELFIKPIEVSIREKIGHIISINNLEQILKILDNIDINSEYFQKQIKEIRLDVVFNISHSSEIGAKYIMNFLKSET